jgi:pimeloyl-ACP methyl ester carboxylesterase
MQILKIDQYMPWIVFAHIILVGCSTAVPPLRVLVSEARDLNQNVFILAFDHDAHLINPTEVQRAAERIADPDIKKIVILSYGWGNESVDATRYYYKALRWYLNGGVGTEERVVLLGNETKQLDGCIIIGIAWDSKALAASRFFSDMIPAPTFGDLLAWIPDTLLFPMSFWSKASTADRIGYGDLKDALEEMIRESEARKTERKQKDKEYIPPGPAPIYVIGHSFGARVISALVQTKQGNILLDNPFEYLHRVHGAVLIQPAMAEGNLPPGPPYHLPADEKRPATQPFPIVVTQSQHDHANSLLFPIANIPLNSYWTTTAEGRLAGTCERRSGQPYWRRLMVDGLRIPLSLALSALATPATYLHAQMNEIWDRHINYIPDSLAQLPVIEMPIWAVDEFIIEKGFGLKRQHWGHRHKGVFSLGALHESVARIATPSLPRFSKRDIHNLDSFLVTSNSKDNIIFVDVSDSVSVGDGLFSLVNWELDYASPWTDFTLAWLDPVGSHFHYREPASSHDFRERAVYQIIRRILNDEITVDKDLNPLPRLPKCTTTG